MQLIDKKLHQLISIHAPREGCDPSTNTLYKPAFIFQSTHPVRGATGGRSLKSLEIKYFNPRTP